MEETETGWKECTEALEREKLKLDVEIARRQWSEMGIAGVVLATGTLLKALGVLELGD